MRNFIPALCLAALLACPLFAQETDQAASDVAAIHANAQAYVEAFNARDAARLAALWSPDAVYTSPETGESATGRGAIQELFGQILSGEDVPRLEVTVTSVDFVSPNVAIEHGSARIIRPDQDPEETEYTAVNMRRDGAWLIDRVTEVDRPVPPPTNYERLKELEWMIGSWVDQDETATVQTDCQWTRNQNFITRSFAVVVGDEVDMAGMQIIGWDPVAEQIRSWVFDSDGGYGEGTWTRQGDRWVIQSINTLPDGGKASAVNIMRYVDENSFTWQALNREVDGELLPNVEEVLIVRKAAD